jgi:3-oxoacyl-[acyl-carrier protein] reductase
MIDEMDASLAGSVALVTGASRGVGARIAELLGQQRAIVAVNYRNKQRRAEEVAKAVCGAGGEAFTVCADITDPAQLEAMFATIRKRHDHLDLLFLNASGGLEKDVAPDYALRLNRDAQLALLDGALPLMSRGARVIFITSHMAHFHGQQPGLDVYEPVAISKRAGEDDLRRRIPELAAFGVGFVVVSGDLIDGTTTPKLMQRLRPGIIEARREQAGWLPTIDDFARAIVEAAGNPNLEAGATVYVGETR